MGFKGLVVLALDLELGLEFFDEELEARNFGAEFLCVGAGNGTGWGLLTGLRALRGLAGLETGAYKGTGARSEGIG